jgi:hypothetical protein
VQYANENYAGGANRISLAQARANYRQLGAMDSEYLDFVRRPLPTEFPPDGSK